MSSHRRRSRRCWSCIPPVSISNMPRVRSKRVRCRRPRSTASPRSSAALPARRGRGCNTAGWAEQREAHGAMHGETMGFGSAQPILRRCKLMKLIPTGETLGANVAGIDLSEPLGAADFRTILKALGEYGVLRFPAQSLDAAALKAFGSRFGSLEINVAGAY